MEQRRNAVWQTVFLSLLSLLFLAPIAVVLINSFKGQFYISDAPFSLPNSETFANLDNYITGIARTNFFSALFYSVFITVCSVVLLVLGSSMTAWFLARAKNRFSTLLYYLFVFSMIVPFQMVMFTMSKIANLLSLDNPLGIILIYLGFGAGLSIFIFTGFVRAIPLEIEEAAVVDGCNPIRLFFSVIFPILRPTAVTVAILNTMWIWNDYLLPYLVIGNDYKTLPIAIQYLQGGYGARDMGALMAMLVLAIIPIVIFYVSCQRYIIKGVVAGAVKG